MRESERAKERMNARTCLGARERMHSADGAPQAHRRPQTKCAKNLETRVRRAIAADRSANDIAKQATMTRETDISAEHAKEK